MPFCPPLTADELRAIKERNQDPDVRMQLWEVARLRSLARAASQVLPMCNPVGDTARMMHSALKAKLDEEACVLEHKARADKLDRQHQVAVRDGVETLVGMPECQNIKALVTRAAERDLIPHDVVSRTVDGATPVRAWREHLGLTQTEVAERLGISQPAYAQQENSERLRKASREKIAAALSISPAQLDF